VETPSQEAKELPGHELGALSPCPTAQEDSSDELGEDCLLRAEVSARIASSETPVRYKGEFLGLAEEYGSKIAGTLQLSREALTLWPLTGEAPPLHQWSLLDLGAIQTSSSSLQISPRTGGVVKFRFSNDSVRRWEGALHRLLRHRFRADGQGEILEFQPRIVAEGAESRKTGPPEEPGQTGEPSATHRPPLQGKSQVLQGQKEGASLTSRWYWFLRALCRLSLHVMTRLEVRGREKIPKAGPLILVANHQSFLDPILVQVACPRAVHTFTKSTQFMVPFFGWVLPRVNAIPTRRYRVDPQVVRVALRMLDQGEAVGIYPEGERSWDGVLQPFRRGTLRFLLGAGVPVVVCGVSGAYDVWPRWSKRIRRRKVVLSFGEPMHWPHLRTRTEREANVPWAEERLRAAFGALGAWEGSKEG
jgi:1-acyl-sn-glycerol-3-phosphate acyltransferase